MPANLNSRRKNGNSCDTADKSIHPIWRLYLEEGNDLYAQINSRMKPTREQNKGCWRELATLAALGEGNTGSMSEGCAGWEEHQATSSTFPKSVNTSHRSGRLTDMKRCPKKLCFAPCCSNEGNIEMEVQHGGRALY
ncbi:hypothetical protein Pcinc_021112 [Petrolisthes cinctipes]|uniref:Uncharacterized protein n=1 Tax=Petrolisthes cinctipes TaxID=88211 RepID=A0AAE1FGL2_PETCI|nr:hypothetical protein Pcinc_021112 [Petrolisthes cinctipes]